MLGRMSDRRFKAAGAMQLRAMIFVTDLVVAKQFYAGLPGGRDISSFTSCSRG